MRPHSLLLLLPGLTPAACYGPADFQEESALTRCAFYEECDFLSALDVEDYDACLALLRSEDYACVTFDAEAARACIDALETLTCEEYTSGEFPMECVDACTLAE